MLRKTLDYISNQIPSTPLWGILIGPGIGLFHIGFAACLWQLLGHSAYFHHAGQIGRILIAFVVAGTICGVGFALALAVLQYLYKSKLSSFYYVSFVCFCILFLLLTVSMEFFLPMRNLFCFPDLTLLVLGLGYAWFHLRRNRIKHTDTEPEDGAPSA